MEKNNQIKLKDIPTEKQIKLYDGMIQAYGIIPEKEKAGEKMKEKGLISKAIQYYNASGNGWSKECEELENWTYKTKKQLQRDTCKTRLKLDINPESKKRSVLDLVVRELHVPEFIPGYYFKYELKAMPWGKN